MLKSVSDARLHFHRNEKPIYFISATPFNLLGIDKWVGNFKYINHIDCFDGRHPNVFVPPKGPVPEFESIEDINNYLLQNKDVLEMLGRSKRGSAVFLMFDGDTEKLAKDAGLKTMFPKARMRNRLDNKVETVRIGNRANVPSVPNVLTKVSSYADLCRKSKQLGTDLVVQTAFGDSGHTTYFIKSEADWDKYSKDIVNEGTVKVMKRINCRQAAIEACTTNNGTVVGPLMTEIVGFKELTPYKGGWAGNEIFPDAFSQDIMDECRAMTLRFGDELRKTGYRGYFELDFLVDMDTGEVWLGELNPRITGTSSLTNLGAFAFADMPLFLFHLLEHSKVPYDINVEDVNQRWANPKSIDSWSQLVMKHLGSDVELITKAPPSGIYRLLNDGSVVYDRFDIQRSNLADRTEGFFVRISGEGDYLYEGADLGILIAKDRMMTKDHKLSKRAKQWIEGIKSHYEARPLAEAELAPAQTLAPGAFKIL